ncbi:hypothetical protein ACFE04_019563 [Oxalis oulophora]
MILLLDAASTAARCQAQQSRTSGALLTPSDCSRRVIGPGVGGRCWEFNEWKKDDNFSMSIRVSKSKMRFALVNKATFESNYSGIRLIGTPFNWDSRLLGTKAKEFAELRVTKAHSHTPGVTGVCVHDRREQHRDRQGRLPLWQTIVLASSAVALKLRLPQTKTEIWRTIRTERHIVKKSKSDRHESGDDDPVA